MLDCRGREYSAGNFLHRSVWNGTFCDDTISGFEVQRQVPRPPRYCDTNGGAGPEEMPLTEK